jgi:hypothetical protein
MRAGRRGRMLLETTKEHRMKSKTWLVTAVAALTASLALTAPAMAKPVASKGKTAGGYEISFKRSGGSLLGLRTMVPTTCAPTLPAPTRAGAELFEPPGRIAVGREVTSTVVQDPAMHYAEVTKNYRVTTKKSRNGTITGRPHVNFSYQTIGYTHSIVLVGYVCQGDDTFKLRPSRR